MNNVYNNGESILGNARDLKEYILKNRNEFEDYTDDENIDCVIEKLEKYNENTIISISYDCYGMFGDFIYWNEKDIVDDITELKRIIELEERKQEIKNELKNIENQLKEIEKKL